MPRFYFHLLNDMDVRDSEGAELPDLAAARKLATCEAQKLMGHLLMDTARINLNHRIDIEDADGRVLDTIWFRDTVTVER